MPEIRYDLTGDATSLEQASRRGATALRGVDTSAARASASTSALVVTEGKASAATLTLTQQVEALGRGMGLPVERVANLTKGLGGMAGSASAAALSIGGLVAGAAAGIGVLGLLALKTDDIVESQKRLIDLPAFDPYPASMQASADRFEASLGAVGEIVKRIGSDWGFAAKTALGDMFNEPLRDAVQFLMALESISDWQGDRRGGAYSRGKEADALIGRLMSGDDPEARMAALKKIAAEQVEILKKVAASHKVVTVAQEESADVATVWGAAWTASAEEIAAANLDLDISISETTEALNELGVNAPSTVGMLTQELGNAKTAADVLRESMGEIGSVALQAAADVAGALSGLFNQIMANNEAALDDGKSRIRDLRDDMEGASAEERQRIVEDIAAQREANQERRRDLRRLFNADRLAQVGSIASLAAVAVMQALAQLGPIAGPIAAVGVGTAAAVSAGTVLAQKNPYPIGGVQSMDSRSTGHVPAMLEPGEGVLSRAAVARIGGEAAVARMNDGRAEQGERRTQLVFRERVLWEMVESTASRRGVSLAARIPGIVPVWG